VIAVPAVALEQVRQELARLGDDVCVMLKELAPRDGTMEESRMTSIRNCGDQIEELQRIVLEFLAKIHTDKLTIQQSQEHIALMTIAVHYREIAEVIEDNLLEAVQTAMKEHVSVSNLQVPILADLYQTVARAGELAVTAVRKHDAAAAESVTALSISVRELANTLMSRLAERMDPADIKQLSALRLQTTLADGLRHIFTLNKRIARNAVVNVI
jgi:phosphate:Na+ symporter